METKDKILDERIVDQIREFFSQLQQPVEVLYFGKETGCDYCADTLQLVEEVSAITDFIHVERYDIDKDSDVARQYNVDKTPGLVIAGRDEGPDGVHIVDYGIRFAGIPSGHEFTSLIQDLVLVSSRDSGLEDATRQYLKTLEQPILLQVFVTPT
jgi:alkyl hydroperoxide reductase subunit AhpF